MAELPSITPEQMSNMIPGASSIHEIGRGGQKIVFSCEIDGQSYAIKIAKVPSAALLDPVLSMQPDEDDEAEDFANSDIALRAKREVETMRDCESPYMVKLGPIGLSFATLEDQQLVYFTEELIEGEDLQLLLRTGTLLPPFEIARLGRQVADAVKSLWDLRKIHRDIKPGNIMRRHESGDFVLLDAGLAFDIDGSSISVTPVGTVVYFSPEQFDFGNRRTVLDFRSDMFSLGVTMYQMATGQHPFWSPGDNSANIFSKILSHHPPPPIDLVDGFPQDLNDVIMRLIAKSPHLRYRKCNQLIEALQGL